MISATLSTLPGDTGTVPAAFRLKSRDAAGGPPACAAAGTKEGNAGDSASNMDTGPQLEMGISGRFILGGSSHVSRL